MSESKIAKSQYRGRTVHTFMKRPEVIEQLSHTYVSGTAVLNTGLIWALRDTSPQNIIEALSSLRRTFPVALPTLPDITTLTVE